MKPDSLDRLQQQFQDYLFSPAQENGEHPASAIHAAVADQFGLPAENRLAIYHHAYRIRLREALEQAFEKTHAYLGDDLFVQLCDSYIQVQPSTFQNLRWYGHQFPDFLAQELDEHPAAAELAAFEWALGLAFDADDAATLCADDVRHLTPEQWGAIGFAVHPSMQILKMNGNAIAIWLALDQAQAPPEAVNGANPGHWLIWRKGLQPQFRSMSRFEVSALQGLQQGQSFADVCEAVIRSAGQHELDVQMAGWLQTWLNDAVLTNYRL